MLYHTLKIVCIGRYIRDNVCEPNKILALFKSEMGRFVYRICGRYITEVNRLLLYVSLISQQLRMKYFLEHLI